MEVQELMSTMRVAWELAHFLFYFILFFFLQYFIFLCFERSWNNSIIEKIKGKGSNTFLMFAQRFN